MSFVLQTSRLKNCVPVGDVKNSGSCAHLPVKSEATAVDGALYFIELEGLIFNGFVWPRYQGVYKLQTLDVKAFQIKGKLTEPAPRKYAVDFRGLSSDTSRNH